MIFPDPLGGPAGAGLPLQPDAPEHVALPAKPAAHEESSLWSWTDLALFLAFAALAFLISSLIVTVGYVSLRSFVGWQATPQAATQNPIFPIALELVFYVLLLGFVYVLIVGHHRQPFWSSLNWRRPSRRKLAGYMLGGLLLALVVSLAPAFLPDKQDFPLEQMFTSPRDAYLVAAFAVFIAPFMEELIFRGVLFAVFERRAGLVFAIVTTALLFASLHIPEYKGAWNHLLLIFLVSVVFSLARGLTGSLAPSVILHFAYNLSLMAALYFQSNHFRDLHAALVAALF